MNPDQLELVTAYVDGEATADERALVEADAELLAEVERQRAIRAELHDVDPPTAAARESAIEAALAVFDDEFATGIRAAASEGSTAPDITAPTNIVPFERVRRIRWMQSLGAAAAVAAVVVAGVVIATRGGDDDGTTADQVPRSTLVGFDDSLEQRDEVAQPPAAEGVETTSAELMVSEATPDTAGAGAAADAAAAESEDDPGAASATLLQPDGAAPAAPAPTNPTAAAGAAPVTTPRARMVVVRNDDDLRELADTIASTPRDVDDAEAACADHTLEADATFETDDGAEVPIIVVAIDADTIGALALDDCDVVIEADH